MKLVFDRSISQLIASEGMQTPVTSLEAVRGEGESIDLVILDNGRPFTPTGLEHLRLVLKPKIGNSVSWQSDAYALASTWFYDAARGCFVARMDYNATLLNELLKIGITGPELENDYIDLFAQFAWRTTSTASWFRSQHVKFRLHNNVWRGYESNPVTGASEESASAPSMVPTFVSITANVVNNNVTSNTPQDITGLSFPVENLARYHFRFCIPYTAAAATTGARFLLLGPNASMLHYRSEYTVNATTRVFNEGLTSYNVPFSPTLSSLTTGNMAIIEGVIRPSADGTLIARFASEISNSAITVLAGANVMFTRLP